MFLPHSFPVPRPRSVAAFRHSLRFALTQLAVTALFAQTPLTLRVTSETVTPGGWAQIKVYADQPALIASGVLVLDLDPRMFGPIESVATFSATGDAIGTALVNGTHAEIGFRSPTGGIGQLPGTPAIAVRAPVLSTASAASFVTLSLLDYVPFYYFPSENPLEAWTDPQGAKYQVNLISSRFTTGGELSVRNITPSGGLLPIGTVLEIEGTGFNASTQVTVDGLGLSSVKLVSPTKMEVTLATSAELTGIHFRIGNPNAAPVDFFPAFPSGVQPIDPTSVTDPQEHIVLPLSEIKTHSAFGERPLWSTVLLNPTLEPVQIRLLQSGASGAASSRTFTVPPGSVRLGPASGGAGAAITVQSDTPLLMATRLNAFGRFGVQRSFTGGYVSPLRATFSYPQEMTVDYQTGTPAPASRSIRSTHPQNIQEVSVKVDAGNWLRVTSSKDTYFVEYKLDFDPTGLAPGKYTGTITATPVVPSTLTGFPVESSTFRVYLNVSAQPTIQLQAGTDLTTGEYRLRPGSLKVDSNGTPAAFTARIVYGDGAGWLSMDKSSGTTPDTLNLSANPAGLNRGTYAAKVVVEGPLGAREYDVILSVTAGPLPPLSVFPASQTYVRESGAAADIGASVNVAFSAPDVTNVKVTASDGGNWIVDNGTASGAGPTQASFRLDASGLTAGTYTATITGTRGNESASSQVVLTVLPKPRSALVASPASFAVTAKVGEETAPQTLSVTSPDGVVFAWASAESGELRVSQLTQSPTPRAVSFTVLYSTPGTYQNAILLSTSAGTVRVPVTIYVTATTDQPPVISSVTSSASNVAGKIAPGELITIRGPGVGPARTGLTLDPAGKIQTEIGSNTKVLLNGVPAPILYASPEQWNVIVPYETTGASASVRVVSGGVESKPWTVPVAQAVPGVFTVNSTGVGGGAILNQDNSVNSPSNPAAKGTILQIYATGGGQSVPAAITGSVTPPTGGGRTNLPVKVRLDGYDAPVTFAGPAPGFASGVLQVNAVIPSEVFGRANVPLILEVDGAVSQSGVTVAIR